MIRFRILLYWPIALILLIISIFSYKSGSTGKQLVDSENPFLFIGLITLGFVIAFVWAFIFPEQAYKSRYRWIIISALATALFLETLPALPFLNQESFPLQKSLGGVSYIIALFFYLKRAKFYPNYTSKKPILAASLKKKGFITFLVLCLIELSLRLTLDQDSRFFLLLILPMGIVFTLLITAYGYYREAQYIHVHGNTNSLNARIDEIGQTAEES